MNHRYENDDILIETIQEKNILKCVQVRKLNHLSFFDQIQLDSTSEEWIRQHRQSKDNVLLEIIYKPKNCFVGTIGFIICNADAEVGRLSLHIPTIKSLIRLGFTTEQLQGIAKSASLLTIDYLFQTKNVERVYCEVQVENYYSNSLCTVLGGIPVRCRKRMKDGTVQEILRYELIKEQYVNEL